MESILASLSFVCLLATFAILFISKDKMQQKPPINRTLLRIIPIICLMYATIFTFHLEDFVNTNFNTPYDGYLEGGPPHLNPRHYFWDNHNSTACFSLDNICHGNDKWFYRVSNDRTSYQPTITYVQDNVTNSHGYFKVEPRIYFNISATSAMIVDDETCPMDTTPFHMVVQSAYNDMMGEFYSRSLVALNQLLHDNPIPGSYYSNLQMYLHVVEKKKQTLFEGHRLFLGGLPNNNKFDSFVSLVENESCQCFQKLVFCGYDMISASEYEPVNKTSTIGYNTLTPEYKTENAMVFKPVGYIKSFKTLCTRMTSGKFDLKSSPCFAYRDLRRDIYTTYANKDENLSHKIAEYRKQILLQKGVLDSISATNDVSDWTFIGLTKRNKRRIWLNMDDTISMCDTMFRKNKVVCFPVDVEEADSPEQQLLMHRSLHAMVGVHGAQLTQGVLLPPHGKILELLPWIPPYLQGNWVQWTNRPTPLGVIYHKTNLNHFGYKLDRNSVPLCFNVTDSDEEGLRKCFMAEGHLRKFQWATRNFNVPPSVVENFISELVLHNELICSDMQKRAEKNGFVLYNAYCRNGTNQHHKLHADHFFTNDGKKDSKKMAK